MAPELKQQISYIAAMKNVPSFANIPLKLWKRCLKIKKCPFKKKGFKNVFLGYVKGTVYLIILQTLCASYF